VDGQVGRVPLVGRAAGLAVLDAAFAAAANGTGRTVVVSGPAGIGKSSLVGAARYPGALVLAGGRPPDAQVAYALAAVGDLELSGGRVRRLDDPGAVVIALTASCAAAVCEYPMGVPEEAAALTACAVSVRSGKTGH
jgi:hypothetical protein